MKAFRHFTIVQYVPDPLADERINIGVIVLDDDVHYDFLSKWSRAKSFGRIDHSYSRAIQFKEELEELCLGMMPATQLSIPEMMPTSKKAVDIVKEMVESWSHVIQFTRLRPSKEPAEVLLARLSDRYLRQSPTKERVGKSKPQVTSAVTAAIRNVIRGSDHLSRKLEIEHKFPLPGLALPEIPTDFSANEKAEGMETTRASGFSVSFQIADRREIEAQFKDSILKINDIKLARVSKEPVVAIAPPLPQTNDARVRLYDDLMSIAKRAGISVIRLDEAEDWAYSTLHENGFAAD